jgi:hypothetical protein
MKLYMFRRVSLSIIRNLFTVHSAIVYVIQVCRQISSRAKMELVSFLVLLDGPRNKRGFGKFFEKG